MARLILGDGSQEQARAAQPYVGIGQMYLQQLKQRIAAGNLWQLQRTVPLQDGTLVRVMSAFGLDTIEILPNVAATPASKRSIFVPVTTIELVDGPMAFYRTLDGPPKYDHQALWNRFEQAMYVYGGADRLPLPTADPVAGTPPTTVTYGPYSSGYYFSPLYGSAPAAYNSTTRAPTPTWTVGPTSDSQAGWSGFTDSLGNPISVTPNQIFYSVNAFMVDRGFIDFSCALYELTNDADSSVYGYMFRVHTNGKSAFTDTIDPGTPSYPGGTARYATLSGTDGTWYDATNNPIGIFDGSATAGFYPDPDSWTVHDDAYRVLSGGSNFDLLQSDRLWKFVPNFSGDYVSGGAWFDLGTLSWSDWQGMVSAMAFNDNPDTGADYANRFGGIGSAPISADFISGQTTVRCVDADALHVRCVIEFGGTTDGTEDHQSSQCWVYGPRKIANTTTDLVEQDLP